MKIFNFKRIAMIILAVCSYIAVYKYEQNYLWSISSFALILFLLYYIKNTDYKKNVAGDFVLNEKGRKIIIIIEDTFLQKFFTVLTFGPFIGSSLAYFSLKDLGIGIIIILIIIALVLWIGKQVEELKKVKR